MIASREEFLLLVKKWQSSSASVVLKVIAGGGDPLSTGKAFVLWQAGEEAVLLIFMAVLYVGLGRRRRNS